MTAGEVGEVFLGKRGECESLGVHDVVRFDKCEWTWWCNKSTTVFRVGNPVEHTTFVETERKISNPQLGGFPELILVGAECAFDGVQIRFARKNVNKSGS